MADQTCRRKPALPSFLGHFVVETLHLLDLNDFSFPLTLLCYWPLCCVWNCSPAWGRGYWPFLCFPFNQVLGRGSEEAQGVANGKWHFKYPVVTYKCFASSDSSKNLEKLPGCSANRALYLWLPQGHLPTEQSPPTIQWERNRAKLKTKTKAGLWGANVGSSGNQVPWKGPADLGCEQEWVFKDCISTLTMGLSSKTSISFGIWSKSTPKMLI